MTESLPRQLNKREALEGLTSVLVSKFSDEFALVLTSRTCLCHGLGMVLPSSVPPARLSNHAPLSLPPRFPLSLLCRGMERIGDTKGKGHKL